MIARLFRVAVPASFARNYTKTLIQTAVMWGVFLILLPSIVAAVEGDRGFPVHRPSAAALFVLFGALGLWGGFVMARVGEGTPLPLDTAPNLVIAGPYRWVRNPMAISAPAQAAALSLWHGSWLLLAYGVGGAIAWNVIIRPPEERDLLERFGAPYAAYRDAVRCWVPRGAPYSPDDDSLR